MMSRRRSIVSDRTKYEIAKELGFADKIDVGRGGLDYGNITTREAGSIVRRLIEKAEEAMAGQSDNTPDARQGTNSAAATVQPMPWDLFKR